MTAYPHRLLLIVPVARCAALNSSIQANLDPQGGDWLTPFLSATGTAPATHAWCCFAATDGEALAWMQRVCTQANIPQPTGWNGWDRNQKLTWAQSIQNQVKTAIGVWIVPAFNDGTWSDPAQALLAMGLRSQEVTT